MNQGRSKTGWSGAIFTLFLVTLLSVTVVVEANGVEYTITQGTFSQTITPLEKAESVEDFYDYWDYEAHTDPDIELRNQSLLFLYKNTNTGEVSLVIIHDDGEGTAGDGGVVEFTFSGLPASTDVSVEDDPEDDDYALNTTINWDWPDYRTDGGAFSNIGNQFTISIDPNFIQGMTDWKVATGNINDPTYVSIPDMEAPIEITTGATVPDAPGGLSGTALSTSEIRLNWSDNSDNEDGFRIYRGGTLVSTVGASVTQYTDTGLASDTTYTYEVTAYNANGESGPSNSINVKTDADEQPDSVFSVDTDTWNLLSIPLTPDPNDCPSVIGDDLPAGSTCADITWGSWNGSDFRELTSMSPFEAYWLWAPEAIELGVSGTEPSSKEVTLEDRTGWIMFGTPVAVNWGDVQIKESGGSYQSIKSVDFTAADSPVHYALFEYSPGAEDFLVYQQPGWDSYTLDPWKGYYIYVYGNANTPISLKFEESGGPPTPPTPPTSATQGALLSELEGSNVPAPPPPPKREATLDFFDVTATTSSTGDGSRITFSVAGKWASSAEGLRVKVKDFSGNTLFSSETTGDSLTWTAEGVPNGTYLYVASVKHNGVFGEVDIGKVLILE